MKFRVMLLTLLTFVLAICAARAEDASDYPSRKIKMLLPFAAGGGGDVIGRLLADKMGKRLGQTIFVENRTGAAGTIGTQMVATSPADGYTIMIGGMTTHVLAPASYANLSYDPIKDFAVIGRIGTSAILVVASKNFPANDLRGLIAMAKKGDQIQYGTWGVGSTGHFCAEILSQKAGIKLEHVPFSGAAKLANDMIGGHISLGTLDMATATPLVKDGKLKALGTCGDRSPSLPEVASYKDQGIDFERSLSWVMYAPTGIPDIAAKKLSAALQESIAEVDMTERLLALGVTADFIPGDRQRDINLRDIEAWKVVAREAKIEIK
ncbi:tripartite tricarboxylate transporter substrate binding protein [Bradyrhizobium sp. AUGA SZCCT0240]|uniref:Bug family tripartite tricarboxylate transporter substrate binding protein n=1 Tax=unclassified Bradyrhizobium TaxID=2631580 RepID=UPI001BACDECF|nr:MULTISPECIES: tripartite tricarboxylate transporter substrate binding protein [unclassified Bradyrhizobium]MBR1197058.1 tripartite tricarboxylate transporter substrate binding protein [Bradyrhizobium sp. AUGA SZCCT0158]MBR1242024.1 tripartite tricarboxylate transporter substrate binding protein [Bradyrhizobium sp. AUGA SZCCT0274]MBR1253969.1 tripartite tricarboxylate transporter substrate binding protein [Bradyrhizobium sp. AUGA SZCCT0240]